MFREPGHADWIEHIDAATLARMRDLILAGEVPARYRRNAEDARTGVPRLALARAA